MRVQIRHSPAELIPTVDGVFSSYFITVKVEIKSCRYATQCFLIYMHLVTCVLASNSYRLVRYAYIAISNWFELATGSFTSYCYS